MRSFGARADTVVCDEPLYAHFLRQTGRAHPGADAVIAAHETDFRTVVDGLVKTEHPGASVFYQKHMAHHLLPEMDLSWVAHLSSVFLIRDPAAMLSSLLRVFPDAELKDTGLPQQVALFSRIQNRLGFLPPVVDSADLLINPERVLRALCERLGIEFQPAMLKWLPGPRDTDGCWGPLWYGSVYQTTGFGQPTPAHIEIPTQKQPVLVQCRDLYGLLARHKIKAL